MTGPLPLLSGRLLVRNGLWNVGGLSVPLVVALFAIPPLIREFGTDRFGVLAIVWAAIGYFGLFDLGLGRALTKLVAERLGRGRTDDLPRLVWTALGLVALLGVAAAIVIASIAPWLSGDVLNVPPALGQEAKTAFEILAVTLPFVMLSAGLIGVLEAHQRFVQINAVRIPLGAFTFLGPLIAVQYAPGLVAATLALAAARVAACIAYLLQCLRVMPALRSGRFDRGLVGSLLSFGGWLTVSNVVGPLMVYFDRFLIGALLTLTAVAYYATPYEFITRLWVLPTALVGVLYPALATASAAEGGGGGGRLHRLLGRAVNAVLLLVLPAVALITLFAPEGLTIWLGEDFASQSTGVLRWLALGVFINSVARIPHALLQGVGRPDLTAKIHLLELPAYAAALWLLVPRFGITGVAAAWTGRIALDAGLLFWLAGRVVPAVRPEARRAVLLTSAGAVVIMLLSLTHDFAVRSGWAVLLIVLSIWLASREARVAGWLAGATPIGKSST